MEIKLREDMMNKLDKLKDTEHMLRWLADEPYSAILTTVENMLKQQVADSQVTAFIVTSNPQWLTGARPTEVDNNKAILVRAAVAFGFDLTVDSQGQQHQLSGVFTWAAVHLDQPEQRAQRTWLDIDGTLAEFGADGALKARLYLELL